MLGGISLKQCGFFVESMTTGAILSLPVALTHKIMVTRAL